MFTSPKCPQCGAELKLGASGRLDAWSCPAGHGVGFTLSEAYDRVQEDEISKIWHGSETAAAGKHVCPGCDVLMVNVTIDVDLEEYAEGQPGDTPDTDQVSLDVCRDDQFMWFDPGELDDLPEDLPDPEPSAAELEKVAQIRKAYDRDIDEALVDDSLLGRFADRVATRHPGFLKFLDRAVYRGALDESDAA